MSAVIGTATTDKSGSTVTASVNGVITTVQVARDLSVATGDVILIERVGAQWFAYSRLFATAPTPPENEIPPDPKPVVTTGALVVSPVETCSYRNGAWRTDTDDVYQGQYGSNGNHTGAVFYGIKPRSLAGATVTAASIQVQRINGGTYAAQATTMRLMTNATKPAGAPALSSTASGPNLAVGTTTNSFTIPNSWVQAMVDGTAGGIAFYDASGSPYVKFAGRGSWSPAFTMTISWQRG